MRLLLIGCSGFIGKELIPQLLNANHQLIVVSRKDWPQQQENSSTENFIQLKLDPADPVNWEEEPLLDAIKNVEGIINLAGEPIAEKRWTKDHRQRLLNSRVQTTESLIQAINKLQKPPRVLINGSAIGIYGTSKEKNFNEMSPIGTDFLANLCKKWEEAAAQKPPATRLVIFRIGIVLGPDGGALAKMLPVFRAGIGGPIGNGLQWMSWIHRTDICKMITQSLIDKSWSGVINGVAPEPIRMSHFASSLGKALGRPSLLSVPGPILKLLLGDGAKVVLEGQKVASTQLSKFKFKFEYEDLAKALYAATRKIDVRKEND